MIKERSRLNHALAFVKEKIGRFEDYPVQLQVDVTKTRFETLFKSFNLPSNFKVIRLRYDRREKTWKTRGPIVFGHSAITIESKRGIYQWKDLGSAYIPIVEQQRLEKRKILTLKMDIMQFVGLFVSVN